MKRILIVLAALFAMAFMPAHADNYEGFSEAAQASVEIGGGSSNKVTNSNKITMESGIAGLSDQEPHKITDEHKPNNDGVADLGDIYSTAQLPFEVGWRYC